jgi:putative membrane protein
MPSTFFLLGLLLLTTVWFGPLPERAVQSFAAHMTMHMGVVALAAPLLALGIAGGMCDPVRKAPALFAPIPISLVELFIVWAWHAPALHHAARHSLVGLVTEQSMFLLSGLLVWLSAFGGEPRQRSNRAAAGIIALLLTSMHMTLLGALLALPLRPLYVHAGGVAGLTPLQDQQLGGAIMLVVGGVSYLLGGLWLTARLLKGGGKKEKRRMCNLSRSEACASFRVSMFAQKFPLTNGNGIKLACFSSLSLGEKEL